MSYLANTSWGDFRSSCFQPSSSLPKWKLLLALLLVLLVSGLNVLGLHGKRQIQPTAQTVLLAHFLDTPKTRIAFTSDRDGLYQIYIINSDGTNEENITNSNSNNFTPSWGPAGKQIVFSSRRDGNSQLYIMNADGTKQYRVTENKAFDEWPAWSPDGKYIAFASTRDGTSQIYIMNADGTNQHPLTETSKGQYFIVDRDNTTQ